MSPIFLLFPIIITFIGAPIIYFIKPLSDKTKKIIDFILVLLASIFSIVLIIINPTDKMTLINFSHELKVYLHLDGLGRVFALMVSILWPFAFLYALGYMEEEERQQEYYMFYVMTFGVVLGISYSGNLITMYFFYELLTLITLPLIIHPMSKEAKRAGRIYLYISLFGSALAFMGIVILQINAHTTEFIYGGIDTLFNSDNKRVLLIAYLLTFIGFGVKAAIFPLHFWLPRAGVAPTPTTALLHAVAVVKAGVFAIMRVTYYNFGSSNLASTWVQNVVMGIAIFTIVFGSSMALKQMHLKRRLAYSTCANISYILLGVTLMSEFGLKAAVLHMLFHSFAKISLFFAAGVMMHKANVTYIDDLNGLGKKMPLTFTSFLLGGLSIIGIPLFSGFLSKWYLATACIQEGSVEAILGIVALLISALLTAIYILTIVIRAFFYKPNEKNYEIAHDGNYKYMIPTLTFAFLSLALGIFGNSFIQIIFKMIEGVI